MFCLSNFNCISIKPLFYGFSYKLVYHNYFSTLFLQNVFFYKNYNRLNSVFLIFFKYNTIFYYVYDFFNKKKYATAAGTYCIFLVFNKFLNLVLLKLPSKKKIFFDYYIIGFLGRSSNIFCKYSIFSSFKQHRKIKKCKQHVRGIAMNPIDHPNGGRSKIKKPFKTP